MLDRILNPGDTCILSQPKRDRYNIMKKRFLLIIFLIFFSAFSLSAKEKLHLKVGTYENSPKIFTNEYGEIKGFWADITKYIAHQEGWKIEWIHGSWDQCLRRLENNEIDIMVDVGLTPSRQERFAFSNETVHLSWTRIYTSTGSDIQTILDLEGKRIAGLKGSFDLDGPGGLKAVTKKFEVDCEIIEMEDYLKIFQALENNEIDAGITDKDFGNINDINFNIERTPIIFQPAHMQFAFSKDSELTPHLIERIDYQINKLTNDKNSIYYRSMDDYLVGFKKITIFPIWLKITIAIILAFALIFFIFILILKKQVNQKTRELRLDIAKRKRAEERIEQLNLVLYSIRNVNQLITKEKDRTKLIKGACENLVETRGFYSTWIVLLDESGKFITTAEAGIGKDFLPLIELMKSGKITACGKSALKQKDIVVTDKPINICKDCPISGKYGERGAMTIRLEYKGKIYGLLSVSVSKVLIKDEEEQSLFKEIASDIAFALYNIETEEESKRIVDELRASEERFRAVVEHSHDGIFIIGNDYKFIYVNDRFCEILGYTREEIIGHDFRKFLDEESRELVSERYIKRQRGEIVSSRYEFDIVRKDGEKRHVEISSTVVKDSKGNIKTIAQILDITERKQAEFAVKERLKELSCLYGISKIIEISGLSLEEIFRRIVILVPASWQYSEIAVCRIIVDEVEYKEPNFKKTDWMQSKKIKVAGKNVGIIEIYYLEEMPDLDEGPFLKEERLVLDAVAERIGSIFERMQAEEALKQSEKNYRILFDNMSEGIFVLDAETQKVVLANRAIAQIYGFDSDADTVNINPIDFILPEDKEEVYKIIAEDMFQNDLQQINEFRSLTNDGREIWISAVGVRTDYKGRLAGLISVRDITERKQAEEFIRTQAEVAKNMAEGSYIVGMHDVIIRWVSPKFETIFGYESGEMTGKHASIVNAPTDLTPEARAEEIMTVVRKTGEWYGDVNNIKKDGTTFWCYVSVSVFNHPKFGEVLLAVHTDITERKQIEEVLKDNEDRYRQIYQFSPDSVIIHDMDMNILDANNKAVEEFGYSKEELLKKKIFDLHPETELKHSAQVLDAMNKKEMMTVETEFVRKNGSVFLSESTPCKYTLGSKPIIHVVIRNITEKRKIEEDIKKRMNELEIFNDITVGRELKMLELKKEINELLKRMGKKEKYEIVE